MKADLTTTPPRILDGDPDDFAGIYRAEPHCAVARDLPPMEPETSADRLRRSQERTITALWIAAIIAIAIGMVLFGRP